MSDLKRYGLKWVGSREFVSHEMPAGYWTPWHIADAQINDLASRLDATASALAIERAQKKEIGERLLATERRLDAIHDLMTKHHQTTYTDAHGYLVKVLEQILALSSPVVEKQNP